MIEENKGFFYRQSNFIVLWIAAIVLQLWDGVLTYLFIGKDGIREANPLMISLLDNGTFLIVKMMSVLVFVVLSFIFYRWFPRLIVIFTLMIDLFLSGIIFWNYLILWRLI